MERLKKKCVSADLTTVGKNVHEQVGLFIKHSYK